MSDCLYVSLAVHEYAPNCLHHYNLPGLYPTIFFPYISNWNSLLIYFFCFGLPFQIFFLKVGQIIFLYNNLIVRQNEIEETLKNASPPKSRSDSVYDTLSQEQKTWKKDSL